MLFSNVIVFYLVLCHANGSAIEKVVSGTQYIVDIMIKSTAIGLKIAIPDQVYIPDVNLKIEKGCNGVLKGKGGVVKGLKSLKTLPLKYSKDDDGAIYIELPIHFANLHIVYPKFSFDCWPFQKKGSADLLLETNKVTIIFKITSPSTFLDKVTAKECVFSVHSIKVSDLGGTDADIKTDGLTGGYLTSFLFPFIAVQTQKSVLNKISLKVTNKISNTLPSSSFWICRDEELEAIIEMTGGDDKDFAVIDLGPLKDHETVD